MTSADDQLTLDQVLEWPWWDTPVLRYLGDLDGQWVAFLAIPSAQNVGEASMIIIVVRERSRYDLALDVLRHTRYDSKEPVRMREAIAKLQVLGFTPTCVTGFNLVVPMALHVLDPELLP